MVTEQKGFKLLIVCTNQIALIYSKFKALTIYGTLDNFDKVMLKIDLLFTASHLHGNGKSKQLVNDKFSVDICIIEKAIMIPLFLTT